MLEELSKQKEAGLLVQHERALSDVKDPLRDKADYARREQAKIKAALAEFQDWRKKNIDSINWKAIRGGLPQEIGLLLLRIEAFKNNLPMLDDSLKKFDALTWEDCWGHRADGQRDVNAAANVRGGFNFNLASGCVKAIKDVRAQLEHLLKEIEARLSWNATINTSPSGAAASINVPVKESGVA
jgi:hypothetical protein